VLPRVSWPFDQSTPLVSAAQNAEYMRTRLGIDEAEWALPPTLLGTFQRPAWERLKQRCGIAGPAPGGDLYPLTGSVDGTSVAIVRMTIGAPVAAMTLELAIARGVRNVLVVGSAGSLRDDLPIGEAVLVTGAEREDGTSHHYLPAGEVVQSDPDLCDRLGSSAAGRGLQPRRGRAWTIDAPFRETVDAVRRHREAGVLVVEMEAAAIFAVARVRGARAALIVAVSDELGHPEWRPGFDEDRYLATLDSAADALVDCAAALA
jgi:uridine phosphorylase